MAIISFLAFRLILLPPPHVIAGGLGDGGRSKKLAGRSVGRTVGDEAGVVVGCWWYISTAAPLCAYLGDNQLNSLDPSRITMG